MALIRREAPPPEPDPEVPEEREALSKVQLHRQARFARLGFEPPDARALALSGADVYRVERMLTGGCDHHTALLIEL